MMNDKGHATKGFPEPIGRFVTIVTENGTSADKLSRT